MDKLTLKAARVNAGLTQIEAAHLIGVAPQTILNYEKGVSFPDVRILKRIEDVYGVDYQHLIFVE